MQVLSAPTSENLSDTFTKSLFQAVAVRCHWCMNFHMGNVGSGMISKGRSQRMRHVSRTYRVDWLFDRINLDPKIQIKYIDTKNQLADIRAKGNSTRDEWNLLVCLFNIRHFSSAECSEVVSKELQT